MRSVLVVAAIAGQVVIGGCSGGGGSSPVPPTTQLSIYAAASLKDALSAAKTAYELAAPGITLTIATDSSATLRTQIEEGAPADVFLSADRANPEMLVDAGLAAGDVVDFAGNRLTLIVPEANPGGIVTLADLARPGVKIVAAGDSVPITKYADQVIARLADEPGYPGDFSVACARNVVSKEESVKAVVAKIQLGEGDAAIVYVTDALATNDVVTIEIPASANILATYAGVVIGTSPRRQAAHAFLDWLRGPEGAKVLRSLGFLPP